MHLPVSISICRHKFDKYILCNNHPQGLKVRFKRLGLARASQPSRLWRFRPKASLLVYTAAAAWRLMGLTDVYV